MSVLYVENHLNLPAAAIFYVVRNAGRKNAGKSYMGMSINGIVIHVKNAVNFLQAIIREGFFVVKVAGS